MPRVIENPIVDLICPMCRLVINDVKQCSTCQEYKRLDDYKDRHQQCNACIKAKASAWSAKNKVNWQKGGKYYKYKSKKEGALTDGLASATQPDVVADHNESKNQGTSDGNA